MLATLIGVVGAAIVALLDQGLRRQPTPAEASAAVADPL
jgi:hypothetical protein